MKYILYKKNRKSTPSTCCFCTFWDPNLKGLALVSTLLLPLNSTHATKVTEHVVNVMYCIRNVQIMCVYLTAFCCNLDISVDQKQNNKKAILQ